MSAVLLPGAGYGGRFHWPAPFDDYTGEPVVLVGPFNWMTPHYKVFRYIGKGRWVPQSIHVRFIGFDFMDDLP